MSWLSLSVCSAVFLGFYDIAKKTAVHGNAVPPVLLLNVLTSAFLWSPVMILSHRSPQSFENSGFSLLFVDALSRKEHILLLAKALLAGSSWIFALFGMKHLPLSIAAPIRASSPMWTILIATVWMHERPSFWQWAGVSIVLISFYAFSCVGTREGIQFHRNRWVGFMALATLLGSFSAIYDKFLLQRMNLTASTVQAWFSVYLVAVMLPLFIHWYFSGETRDRFFWRWSIPLISVSLLISDFLYFSALRDPAAMISLVSPMRRTSIVIPFFVGAYFLREKNWRAKAACLATLLTGVYLISIAKSS